MSLACCIHGYISYTSDCMTCPEIKRERLDRDIQELEEWHANWEKEHDEASGNPSLPGRTGDAGLQVGSVVQGHE